jgi:hypothetical protein
LPIVPESDALNAVALALGRGARSGSPWRISEALGDLLHLERGNPGTLMAHAHLRQVLLECAYLTHDGVYLTNHPISLASAIVGTIAAIGLLAGIVLQAAAPGSIPSRLRYIVLGILLMIDLVLCAAAAHTFYRHREWTRSVTRLKLIAECLHRGGGNGVLIAEHLATIAAGLPRLRRLGS